MHGGPNGDGGYDDTGDGGDSDDDDGDPGGDDGATGGDDDGGSDQPPGDDGGDDGDTSGDDGGDTDTGGDDGGDPGSAPDCRAMWVGEYIPATQYMTMKIPETADEMFCYVNMNRINYQFHGRNDGCIWGGSGNDDLSWPYEMVWDADLTARAQTEAERVAGGGQPNGIPENNGFDHTLYADGCASNEYTVTSPNDLYADWEGGNKAPGLSKSNGTARMGVHYYDPGSSAPTLTKMGVGLAEVGNARYWVVKFGQ
jgi:hypothetical protein